MENYIWSGISLIPFQPLSIFLFPVGEVSTRARMENLPGNIAFFIPFGFFLPFIAEKFRCLKRIMMAIFGFSLTYEFLQLLFRFCSFDVDDLLLNTLGGVAGYLPFFFLKRYIKKKGIQPEEMENI